ncbi:MAG TPA: SDR family oxidoreductase [Conexibacter sp.]
MPDPHGGDVRPHSANRPCDGRLAGVHAVVTGATSGIGRAIAERLAHEGARVLFTYRASADEAEAVAREIRARGGHAECTKADVSTSAGCEALVAEARQRLGHLDVWINNAGADILVADVAARPWEQRLDALLAVDLRGTIACCHAVGDVMLDQPDGGTLLNMSWDHVATGMAGHDSQLFAAVKGGVLAYSRSLARSLAPKVRVNVLSPGWIETRFGREVDRDFHESVAQSTPLGRWGRPEDVAAAAVYLASAEAAFITGQSINVNGGVVME